MDTLKTARREHDRIFTKACNEFDTNENDLSFDEKVLKLPMNESKTYDRSRI